MTNKWQALQEFWSSFGWDAYDENSVDTGAFAPEFPYITYAAQTGVVGQVLTLTASLWDKSTSWVDVSDKTSIQEAYSATVKECGPVDILIQCAGIVTSNATFDKLTHKDSARSLPSSASAPAS